MMIREQNSVDDDEYFGLTSAEIAGKYKSKVANYIRSKMESPSPALSPKQDDTWQNSVK